MELADPPEVRVKLIGLHVTVRPVDGDTDTDNVSDPLNPLTLWSVSMDVPEEPTGKVTVDGLDETLKSGGVTTLTLIATVCDREPLVPTTVTV